MSAPPPAFSKIQHFFVLMLENRSFDHMFGSDPTLQSGPPLTGAETCPFDPRNPVADTVPVGLSGPDITRPDPPHEFKDVCYQSTGYDDGRYAGRKLSMDGFAASARRGLIEGESLSEKARLVAARGKGEYALECQGSGSVGVLRTLAREYAVCENWFSPMPGPTWPNRFFVHAGSSAGLDNSPSAIHAGAAIVFDDVWFEFENGTIFDRLGKGRWRVYHDDPLPQVLAIKGMIKDRLFEGAPRRFQRLDRFADDLRSTTRPFAPNYIFIEPKHDALRHSRDANSQHPEGRVVAGERLIRDVYLALRHSPIWEKSALVITYDEHGGFYDRREPPQAVPPGDSDHHRGDAEYPAGFDFSLLGPRVPAVVVSPWVARNTIDSTVYDHTSIIRTVSERFGLKPLTARDRSANSFSHLFSLENMRSDNVQLEVGPGEAIPPELSRDVGENAAFLLGDEDPLNGDEAGFLRIAVAVKSYQMRQAAPLGRRFLDLFAGNYLPEAISTQIPTSRQTAREFVAEVSAELDLLDAIR